MKELGYRPSRFHRRRERRYKVQHGHWAEYFNSLWLAQFWFKYYSFVGHDDVTLYDTQED